MSYVAMPQSDFSNMQPGQGFTEFPQGDYLVTIVDVPTKTNQKPDAQGNPVQRLTPKMRIEMGPGPGITEYNGKHLWGSYNVTQEGMPYLLGLFSAALGGGDQGLAQARQFLQQCAQVGQLNTQPLLNKQIVVHVQMRNNWPNVSTERGSIEWGQPTGQAQAPATAQAPAMMQPMWQQPAGMQQQQMPQGQMPQGQMPGQMPQGGMPQSMPQGGMPQGGMPGANMGMGAGPGGMPTQAPQQAQMPQQVPGQMPQQQQQQPQQQAGSQFMAPPPPAGMVPGQTQ